MNESKELIKIKERQEATRARLAQLKAREASLIARQKKKQKDRQRAEDTRRKILAGALVLDLMARDDQTRTQFLARLDTYLTRADDRGLFDLPPLPTPEA